MVPPSPPAELVTEIMEHADAVCVFDTEFRYLYVNAAYERLVRTPREQLIGRSQWDVFPQARDPKLRYYASLQRVMRERTAVQFDEYYAPYDLWTEVRAYPGSNGGVLLYVRDASRRMRNQRILQEHRALLDAIVHELPVGAALVRGSDLVFLAANPAFEAMASPGATIAGRPLDAVWMRAQPGFRERVQAVLASGQRDDAIDAALEGPAAEGATRCFNLTLHRVALPAGQGFGVLCTLQDTTEQRAMREDLRQSTTLLQAISDSSADLIFAKDREGRFLFANPATLQLIGKPLHEVVGRDDTELLDDPRAAAQVMAHDRQVMASGTSIFVEETVPTPGGEPRTWFSRKTPYRDAEGKVTGVLGISRDVTAQKRSEAALQEVAAANARDRAQLEAVLQSMADGVAIVDLKGNFVFVNEALARIIGQPAPAALRQSLAHYADRFELREVASGAPVPVGSWPISRVMRGESLHEWECLARERATGRTWYFSFSGQPVRSAEGTQILGVVVLRDITDRRRSELALQTSEATAEGVLRALAEGVVVFDTEGRVVSANEALSTLLGVTVAEFHDPERDPRTRILRGDGTPVPRHELPGMKALSTGRPVKDVELGLRHDDGRITWISSNAQPIRDPEGRLLGAVSSFFDITARKETELALRDADRRKDEFLSMLSHELRNPLAPIRNAVHILHAIDTPNEDARRARDVIARQTDHLARLVDDLLDVTRIARGKIELRRECVDLADLARRTVDDHRDLFRSRDIALAAHLPDAPLWADADPARLAQVAGNLLENAAKFTPAGRRVTLALERSDAEAVLTVTDEGIGIEPDLLGRIFEPFVQGERSLARTQGGLGLGLAVVRSIVELHGGSVRAASAGANGGTSFEVRIPLGDPVAQAAAPPVAPRAARRRVLVIDDNRDAADTLAQLVALLGHDAEVAYDATEALTVVRGRPPDLVLCDIGLPGMDGYGFARAVREQGMTVSLVAVTGYAQPEDVQRASAAGFDAHVSKPPRLEDIEALVADPPKRHAGADGARERDPDRTPG